MAGESTVAKELRLICLIIGSTGATFHVIIKDDRIVSELKESINKKLELVKPRDVNKLQLYEAKSHGNEKGKGWMKKADPDKKKLINGDEETVQKYLKDELLMDPEDGLDDYFTEKAPEKGEIHVLVKLPEEKKGEKWESCFDLEHLYKKFKYDLNTLPTDIKELRNELLKPLPFRLNIMDDIIAEQIFDPHGEMLQCTELETLINKINMKCQHPPKKFKSENSCQSYYDLLLDMPEEIWTTGNKGITIERNKTDFTTAMNQRPDCIILREGLVMLRGEEKSGLEPISKAISEVTTKMCRWNPFFYGELPYIFGYATSGSSLAIFAILPDRQIKYIVEKVLFIHEKDDRSITIKFFFNLAFFLPIMIDKCGKDFTSVSLTPFVRYVNNYRTIEVLDNGISRRIRCGNDETRFQRLVNVYETLESLGNKQGTCLQTVSKMIIKSTEEIQLLLNPMGFSKEPKNESETREWLRCMLRALTYWHAANYCHGDIRWPNIVYVPAAHQSFWVLIDMDESYRPNTQLINWLHQCKGQILTFQHDLCQLGYLLMDHVFESRFLMRMKEKLLSCVTIDTRTMEVIINTDITAEGMLQEYNMKY